MDISRLCASWRCPRVSSDCLAGALHEDAGNNLKTVRDTVLNFLQEDGFLAQKVVLQLLACPSLGYIRYGQEHTDLLFVVVVEFVRIHDKQPWSLSVAFEVELVGMDLGGSRGSSFEKRGKLGDVPFALPQSGKPVSRHACRFDLKVSTERGAGGDHSQVAIHEQHRRIRRGDDCHHQAESRGFRMETGRDHEVDLPSPEVRESELTARLGNSNARFCRGT